MPAKNPTEYSRQWRKRNRERHNANKRAWYRRNTAAARATQRKWQFGITDAEYQTRLAQQDNRCAICRRAETDAYAVALSVDHDHQTGRIRGLLCRSCNLGLGKFKDSPEALRAAALYLEA